LGLSIGRVVAAGFRKVIVVVNKENADPIKRELENSLSLLRATFESTADGVLVYAGAIDNDSGRQLGDVNYVVEALEAVLAGETPKTQETKAYGCSVKY